MRRRLQDLARLAETRGVLFAFRTVLSYVHWRLRGSPIDTSPPTIEQWLSAYGDLMPDEVGTTQFSIVCPMFNSRPDLLAECVQSVLHQRYESWQLVLVNDGSTDPSTSVEAGRLASLDPRIELVTLPRNQGIAAATNAGIAAARGEYIVFLDHDDLLAPTALAWLSVCAPEADLIYTDADHIDVRGEHSAPFFKPAWSPRLLTSVNYVNHLMCVRAEIVRQVGGMREGLDGVQDHDFLLRLVEMPVKVAHIPNILYHWRIWPGTTSQNAEAKLEVEARGIRALHDAIERRGWRAHAGLGNGMPFNYRVYFDPGPAPPDVKVVMPTRDGLRFLRAAVDGVLHRTDGVNVHLVIVDNGSRQPTTLRYLEQLRENHANVTIHRIDDAFNYSRLCNEGVSAGPETELVLLMNNDVEVLDRRWLLQLTGWLRDPAVGGVGPKLRFPDGRIQHAGVIIGLGGSAGHYAGYQDDEPRVGDLHDQAREVGALTAACLLLRTRDYRKVGGMTEALPLDFQDVDLCLRLRRDLESVLVYDPTFPLIHLQSATRGKVSASSRYTFARLAMLWGSELSHTDPYYSAHLTRTRTDFSLEPIPQSEAELKARITPRFSTG